DLHPKLEGPRLPLAVHLDVTVAGRALRPGTPASGPLAMTLRIANQSAVPVTIKLGAANPEEVGAALDATRRALGHRERPEPGSGGIPSSLTAVGPARSVTEQIEAPFHVTGTIAFAQGTMTRVRASGAGVIGSGHRFVTFEN